MKQEIEPIFFQEQGTFSLYCGLHCLNNIVGSQKFTKESLNSICYELSDALINPHKHPFGGDYDVNVLMIALQNQNLACKWFDRRKKTIEIQQQNHGKQLVGYLVNIYVAPTFDFLYKLCGISNRHWIAVRRINNNKYYYLDSKIGYDLFSKVQMQQKLQKLIDDFPEQNERAQIIQVYYQKQHNSNQQRQL